MNDVQTIEKLRSLCDFSYTLEDGKCTQLSFYNEDCVFGGTLRKNPAKHHILGLVSRFENLKSFNARKCKLGNLPPFATKLLETLDLSCNDLDTIPTWVGEQHSLTSLNVGANKLTDLPESITALPLETLKVHKNRITNIPCLPPRMRILNLYLNPLPELPKSVLNLEKLESLAFGVTDVETLPSLAGLKNLRWLTMTVNKLKELPEDVCLLQNLETLQLAKNCLEKLPSQIGRSKLKRLGLYSNRLTTVPESLFDLALVKLNLARNPLTAACRQALIKTFDGIEFLRI